MKETNIRELQHHLSDIMKYVEHGEEVLIKKRRRVIARIVPDAAESSAPPWPDFLKRARSLFPETKGPLVTEILLQERNERW